LKEHFLLDPQVIFLNHGSYGATPKFVFERYQAWQFEMERQPVEFISRRAPALLQEARQELANYLHTSPDNLVFMTNVTVALNAVARSLPLKPGDEVLTTNQEYGALDKTWQFLALKQGFKYINTPIDMPVTTSDRYIENLWSGVTSHTRVIFISQISSPTSVIAPIKEICQRARQQGILTIVDGAHAPGQIPVDLEDLGADFYGANLHKWLCAPKGSGFLYAAQPVHALLEPLIVSFGWQSDQPGRSRLVDYYEYLGTRDLSAFLAVPAAIEFQKNMNWDAQRQRTHELAKQCIVEISEMTGLTPLYAPDSQWYAQMVSVPLPQTIDPQTLKNQLYDQFKIEIPVLTWNQIRLVRASFQAYNSRQDLDRFVSALHTLIASSQ
jgi:isopenicillin-N epimerase